MDEKGGGAGTGERGGYLAGDVPRFAHTGDDDAALDLKQNVARVGKSRSDAILQLGHGTGFHADGSPRRVRETDGALLRHRRLPGLHD